MECKVAVLADYANVAEGQKLNVMGIFTTIFASKVPAACPQMFVVTQFECDMSDAGEKTTKTALVDADGRVIFQVSGQVVIPKDPSGNPSLFNQLLALNNYPLPAFGDYQFRIFFDDMQRAEILLHVMPIGGTEHKE